MKLSIAILAAALTVALGYTAYQGRRARLTRDLTVIAHHYSGTNWVMGLVFVAIVLIEVLIHRLPGIRPPLLWAHLPFAVLFAVLFLTMRFWFTGMRSSLHRHLAYACLAAYAGALVTGGITLYRF